jgi:DNA-binding MarR family transcriptional regulator
MPGSQRSPDEREAQLEQIARRHLIGESQTSIANDLKISQATVSGDLKEIRSRWLASSVRDFDDARSIELAKIDLVEAEFWQQWEKSKELKRTRKQEDGLTERGEMIKTTVVEEQRCGNAAYLMGVMACVERRCKLLGLDSELKYQDLSVAIEVLTRNGFAVERRSDEKNLRGSD